MHRWQLAVFCSLLVGCGTKPPEVAKPPPGPDVATDANCASGRPMRVHFYDVGQGLAVLVTLPDARQILIDTGDAKNRPGCGLTCAEGNQHLLAGLTREVHDEELAMLWITHQHSDHIGGAVDVLQRFKVGAYADNGRDDIKPLVEKAHIAAGTMGAQVTVVAPGKGKVPIADGEGVKLTAVLPAAWPEACSSNPNDCSIGLRIDYCKSSVLFTGDAEASEEAVLDTGGPVTLLQVAHHGAETSSSDGFLAKATPKYAVISSGRPGVGLNQQYCHPRKSAIERLGRVLGAPGPASLQVFGGASCKDGGSADWSSIHVSDRLFSTARDGDVVLMTTGNGNFVKE